MFGHSPVRAVWVERAPVWSRGVFGGHEVSYNEGEVCRVCQEALKVRRSTSLPSIPAA